MFSILLKYRHTGKENQLKCKIFYRTWHHWQIYFLTSFRGSKPVIIYLSYIDSYGAAGWQWQVKLDIYGCLPQDIFSINRSSKLLHFLSNEEKWAGRSTIIIRRFRSPPVKFIATILFVGVGSLGVKGAERNRRQKFVNKLFFLMWTKKWRGSFHIHEIPW